MSRDDHDVQLIKFERAMAAKTKTKHYYMIAVLHRCLRDETHPCGKVVSAVWTESSWAFRESYTADDSWIVCSSDGGQRRGKSAHNSTTKVRFFKIIL